MGKKLFQHNFYIVDIPEISNFHRILGMDFIKSNHVNIDFANNSLRINNDDFSFALQYSAFPKQKK